MQGSKTTELHRPDHGAGRRSCAARAARPCFSILVLFAAVSCLGKNAVASNLLYASPTSLSFGNVTVGSSSTQTVTLTCTPGLGQRTGSVTVSQATVSGAGFSISGLSSPLTLTAGQSTTFNAIFAPTSSGNVTGNISIASNATNSPATVSLSGTGVTLLLGVNPTSLSFGNVTAGSSSTQTVTLTNTGTGSVTISQATVSGAGFSISGLSLPLTLTAGQSTAFNAIFAPTSSGNVTGNISIASNATNSPATVSLSGTGVTLLLGVSPTSLSFGNVTVGSSSTQTVTLTCIPHLGKGTGSVTVSQATVSGAGFSISGLSLPLTLTAGRSTTFNAIFAPTSSGSVTGSISIASNATNSPATVSLSGTGVTLLLGVSPTSTAFGNVVLSYTSSLPVILMNQGTGNVTITQASVAGTGFAIAGLNLPLTLPAGQNTSFNVNFSPTTVGSVAGNVSVVSNATNSPTNEALSGTGVHGVSLAWTASTSPDVIGYNVYRSSTSGSGYSKLNSSLVTETTYSDTVVQAGQTYYYVTTAVNSSYEESSYSNQTQATVPSP